MKEEEKKERKEEIFQMEVKWTGRLLIIDDFKITIISDMCFNLNDQ